MVPRNSMARPVRIMGLLNCGCCGFSETPISTRNMPDSKISAAFLRVSFTEHHFGSTMEMPPWTFATPI